MKKRILATIFSVLLLGVMVAGPVSAQLKSADDLTKTGSPLDLAANKAGYSTTDKTGASLSTFIGGIISGLLGLLGVIAVVLIIYAGFLWMTARGESSQVDKAKDILKQAIIGLIIIVMAYGITTFVLDAIKKAS